MPHVAVGSNQTAIRTQIPTSWQGSTLKKGSRGQYVKDLQNMLTKAGFKLSVDGIYGSGTANAVKSFQKKYGLTQDGIAGKNTFSKLKSTYTKTTVIKNGSYDWTGQTLKKGSKGESVRDLQTMLNKAGFSVGSVDGIYGDKTLKAVEAFQRKVGLSQDGVAGANTYNKLKNYKKPSTSSTSTSTSWTGQTLKEGSSGNAVKSLQNMLEKAGFDLGAVDGKFGVKTERAVLAFQKQVGLKADGIAGKDTYNKLKSYKPLQPIYDPTVIFQNKFKAADSKINSKGTTWSDVTSTLKDLAKAGFDFVIGDDIKTLADPKANTLDKALAALSFIPPAKVVTKGIKLVKLGSKIELKLDLQFFGSNFINIKNKKIIDTATLPKKGGETVVGHALQKHAGRNPQIWGKVKGNSEQINKDALSHLNDILKGDGEFKKVKANNGVEFLEKKLSDGRGVRLNLDGTFKGFIDQ